MNLLKRIYRKLGRMSTIQNIYKRLFSIVGLLPVNKKLIVFESFLGKQYSDNPRAIFEYLKKIDGKYKIYWSVDARNIMELKDHDLNILRRFSLKWFFVMPRAKYWITNTRLPLWIPKPKHTIYLQTWHGTPLKKLAADMKEVHMPGTSTEKYKKNFLGEAAKWDYLISPNQYSTEIFKRAFGFEKTVIESGYPRNDYLYNYNTKDHINQLIKKLGLPSGKKIILYAPTWRDNNFYEKGKYKFDLELDLQLMHDKLGEDYVVLLRMHYLVAENINTDKFKNFAYNFSFYEDIRDLYLISDILITDYSSVFFDYANLRRPMLFFVYDIEEYRDNLRGFYFNFEEDAPGPLVKTTEELIKEIVKVDNKEYDHETELDMFVERFCSMEDGNASKRVVDELIKN